MRHTQDFITLLDAISRVRASGLPTDIAEAAVRASFEEYRLRSQDVRLLLAAERIALNQHTATPEARDGGQGSRPEAGPKERPVHAGGRKANPSRT